MQESSNDKTETSTDQKAAKKHGLYISAGFAGFMEVLLGSFGTVILTIGGSLLLDAQLKWTGIFLVACALGSFVGVLLIHWRHRYRDKRIPAMGQLFFVMMWIILFFVLGISSWWFTAFKDRDSFNVIVGARLVNIPNPANPTFSRFSAALSLTEADTVLNPIDELLFVRVTNKQTVPVTISGLSLEVADDSWWPFGGWIKLCRVDVRTAQIIFLRDDGSANLLKAETFEKIAMSGPLAPALPINGWTAWECPKGDTCNRKYLRIGVSDSAGVMSWQVQKELPISPDFMDSGLMVLPGAPVKIGRPRLLSSCRSK